MRKQTFIAAHEPNSEQNRHYEVYQALYVGLQIALVVLCINLSMESTENKLIVVYWDQLPKKSESRRRQNRRKEGMANMILVAVMAAFTGRRN